MKIRIKSGLGNFQFEHRKKRFLLECSPVIFSPTLANFAEGERRKFVYAKVSLLQISTRPLHVKKEHQLSSIFYDSRDFESAVSEGFEVQRDSRTAARFLVKAGLAEFVD